MTSILWGNMLREIKLLRPIEVDLSNVNLKRQSTVITLEYDEDVYICNFGFIELYICLLFPTQYLFPFSIV